MNIGIVVEGQTDGKVYSELLRRIRDDLGELQVRACGGKSRLKGLFPAFLKEFERNHAWQIEFAVVIRDSDCHPCQQVEEQLRNVLRSSGFIPNFAVEFFAAKCDLETWLLVDQDAINRVSQSRGKDLHLGPLDIQFESTRDTKRLFLRRLSNAGLPSDPEVYREIAACIDLARTAARCPSFRAFINRIKRTRMS